MFTIIIIYESTTPCDLPILFAHTLLVNLIQFDWEQFKFSCDVLFREVCQFFVGMFSCFLVPHQIFYMLVVLSTDSAFVSLQLFSSYLHSFSPQLLIAHHSFPLNHFPSHHSWLPMPAKNLTLVSAVQRRYINHWVSPQLYCHRTLGHGRAGQGGVGPWVPAVTTFLCNMWVREPVQLKTSHFKTRPNFSSPSDYS